MSQAFGQAGTAARPRRTQETVAAREAICIGGTWTSAGSRLGAPPLLSSPVQVSDGRGLELRARQPWPRVAIAPRPRWQPASILALAPASRDECPCANRPPSWSHPRQRAVNAERRTGASDAARQQGSPSWVARPNGMAAPGRLPESSLGTSARPRPNQITQPPIPRPAQPRSRAGHSDTFRPQGRPFILRSRMADLLSIRAQAQPAPDPHAERVTPPASATLTEAAASRDRIDARVHDYKRLSSTGPLLSRVDFSLWICPSPSPPVER